MVASQLTCFECDSCALPFDDNPENFKKVQCSGACYISNYTLDDDDYGLIEGTSRGCLPKLEPKEFPCYNWKNDSESVTGFLCECSLPQADCNKEWPDKISYKTDPSTPTTAQYTRGPFTTEVRPQGGSVSLGVLKFQVFFCFGVVNLLLLLV
ncbi:hypothetical protein HELRODRAFT_176993 [Helobdella robusta]|uniref:Uncharacterized protein n=1 Tax=Helobdella robusta TaxID=6412 RepID=T1FB39_HELRO|nr:hypothetical protein HELRODRAFT_176993 [Helobdella robusta]ESN98514.1 hypothetical protein HELRODRAFT_176993 [Helobdella robusta]